ncbi:MAG: endonuclease III domain-containing protein [Syntrophales bacterium]
MKIDRKLLEIYNLLHAHFGDQGWWPADSPFEVIVGAILTQNTSWANVEKAIWNLKSAGLLTPGALRRIEVRRLAELIRPSGYYNIKTVRLKNFLNFLEEEYCSDLERMFAEDGHILRRKLLAVKGIGPETADSILLYAGNKPVFVVDVYTRRILERHRVIREGLGYEEIQSLFMDNLPASAELFNQYHALIVNAGKSFCRKRPRCGSCPLGDALKKDCWTRDVSS